MYALIGKCRNLGLPIDLQFELFDRMIVPIILYGCEVWGPEHYIETEKLHLKSFKHILGVHGRTTNNIVYGEWGRLFWKFKLKKDDWSLGEINYRKGIKTMQSNI